MSHESRQARPGARLYTSAFTAKASTADAAKWRHWARESGYKSVGRWVSAVVRAEVERLERERGVCEPPSSSRLL